MRQVIIYANGFYNYSAHLGGWGTVIVYGEHTKELSGVFKDGNQYHACLMAALEGLRALKKEGLDVLILSSSSNMISPMQHRNRIERRLAAGEQSGEALWRELLQKMDKQHVTAGLIPMDSNDKYNRKSLSLGRQYIKLIPIFGTEEASSEKSTRPNGDAYKRGCNLMTMNGCIRQVKIEAKKNSLGSNH